MEKRKPCCGKTQAHLRTVLASRYRCGVRELEVMLDDRFKKKQQTQQKGIACCCAGAAALG